ncbi:MAG: hypothetical protein A2474_01035 [Elusimicrobia bacterium RIFOXYC2_FULL_34_12]|nr:MAG: hypothetical protein A2474_01035 [Elusimicrobia bacterium RIFOXYC2_FULL_34_12]OGS38131.1 MAG: hypothetical protein A2551_04280 [Elusimicrobia bacterium RIFOXYD2_FULL_34_30]
MIKDITKIFQKTNSHIIKNLISSGSIVLGIKIEGKAGLLVKDVKYSDNLQEKITKGAKIPGFMSTDELPHYGLTKDEKVKIEKAFDCKKKDVVVFVAAETTKAKKAIEIIEAEMKKAKIKTPKKIVSKEKKKTVKAKNTKKAKNKKKK